MSRDEEGVAVSTPHQSRPRRPQEATDPSRSPSADGHNTVLPAFAAAHDDDAPLEIEGGQGQVDELLPAQAGSVEKLQEGSVAKADLAREVGEHEDPLRLPRSEHRPRQGSHNPWQPNACCRVTGKELVTVRPAQKPQDRREAVVLGAQTEWTTRLSSPTVEPGSIQLETLSRHGGGVPQASLRTPYEEVAKLGMPTPHRVAGVALDGESMEIQKGELCQGPPSCRYPVLDPLRSQATPIDVAVRLTRDGLV